MLQLDSHGREGEIPPGSRGSRKVCGGFPTPRMGYKLGNARVSYPATDLILFLLGSAGAFWGWIGLSRYDRGMWIKHKLEPTDCAIGGVPRCITLSPVASQ
jgi:hypothetical protein